MGCRACDAEWFARGVEVMAQQHGESRVWGQETLVRVPPMPLTGSSLIKVSSLLHKIGGVVPTLTGHLWTPAQVHSGKELGGYLLGALWLSPPASQPAPRRKAFWN